MKADLTIISPSEIGNLTDSARLILANLVSVDIPHQINPHRHERGQLVYASHGNLQVMSMGTSFMVPSQFAAWIPPGVIHSVTSTTPIDYCSLFIDASVSDVLPGHTQLLHLTSLLKELTRTAANGDQSGQSDVQARLNSVILDQLRMLRPACVALPIPGATRTYPLVEHFLSHPGDQLDLPFWSAQLSMSERTLTRNFKRDTGLTLGQWLQHVKVLKAIELLEAGKSVKATAYDVGYQQPSAFISMFKRITGSTPRDYLHK